MVSAILIDRDLEPIQIIKQVSNFFVADKAYEYATGELSISIKDRRSNNHYFKTRTVFIFGEGMLRMFAVNKLTTDNTGVLPKLTFELVGIEYLFNQRNEQDKDHFWYNLNPMEICNDLFSNLQADEKRRFEHFENETIISGTMDKIDAVQMPGGNIWTFFSELMEYHKFCIDAVVSGNVNSFGKSKLRFRIPVKHEDILLSDFDKKVYLQYINLDYSEVVTAVTVGGEGEGIRRKYASFDSGETGIDRFEEYSDESSIGSNEGYISNEDYYKMLTYAAEIKMHPSKIETDYVVPSKIFNKINTGDTIYTSSLSVNEGKIEERIISELKTEISDGVLSRSITLI